MSQTFYPGEKLTAQKLNDAILASHEGLYNPSNSYHWTRTQYGDLQTSWDNFSNTKNINPNPLDVEVCVDPLQSPVTLPGGEKLGAVRRVFMNTGEMRSRQYYGPYQEYNVLPLGDVNGNAFAGVIGMQVHWSDGLLNGDNDGHFSLWCSQTNKPQDLSSATDWTTVQKLWRDDVGRNGSQRNWWWTGLTLEHLPQNKLNADPSIADVVTIPLLIMCVQRKNVQPSQREDIERYDRSVSEFPILVVGFRYDFTPENFKNKFMYDQTFANKLQESVIQNYGDEKCLNFDPDPNLVGLWIEPSLQRTVAQYIYGQSVQNAFYKQQTNQISYQIDSSPWRVASFGVGKWGEYYPQIAECQYTNARGEHIISSLPTLSATDWEGNELCSYNMTRIPYMLAAAYDYGTDKLELSCVSCLPGTETQALNEMFDSLSGGDVEKRAIWINTATSQGIKYYDTELNFSKRDVFHFKWKTELSSDGHDHFQKVAKIGEGVVQVGGYSYFSDGGRVQNMLSSVSADQWVCAEVGLYATPTFQFKAFPSISALNDAQGDHTKYIFPLYKVKNFAVQVDYRPLANAGCWELPEQVEEEEEEP